MASKLNLVEKDFPVAHATLLAKTKDFHEQDLGNLPNKAKELTHKDQEKLWTTGVLGDSVPETLKNTLWYLCTNLLGFRDVQEDYMMHIND